EPNPFVQLLWEKGTQHEKRVIEKIGGFEDLSIGSQEDRFNNTIDAMKAEVPLIYQGLLMNDILLGVPDLLRINPDKSYSPIDIKSGAGVEGMEYGDEEGKLKEHYAVQLCLYADLLISLGFSDKKVGFIIDIHGNEITYQLTTPINSKNSKTFWDSYEEIIKIVSSIIQGKLKNKPALSGVCKLCGWVSSCKKWCEEQDDLTRIFYLGRAQRDKINDELEIGKVKSFCDLDIPEILERKKKDKAFLKGLAEKTLVKYRERAKLISENGPPVLYGEISFPKVPFELFFDIEDDPTQDFVYMHGVYERGPSGEKYFDFTATEVSPEAEKAAWKAFWDYIKTLPRGEFATYYYSHHEKTVYKRLLRCYPDVISDSDLEDFFNDPNTIDLYKIVQGQTDWPLSSYSIKEIATYLGFSWRDETPSGALSIQWFNEYLKNKDPSVLKRIREYNEDDCKATKVVKDGIQRLADGRK
ncbi:MAG: TM0106 family RecB-like putative nuclease, partial [Candidatus Brocadia sp.]